METLEQYQCQVLPAEYLQEAARVMAQAFSNYPVYTYIFKQNEQYRKEALEWLFLKNLHIIHSRCPTAFRGILDEKGEVVACFLWTPSEFTHISNWDMIKAGVWKIPIKFGFKTLKRLLESMDDSKSAAEKFFDASSVASASASPKYSDKRSDDSKEQFIMLERLVVRPDWQGKGLGSKCLKAVMAEAKVPMRLMTQEEINDTFHQRLGFCCRYL